MKYIQKRFKLIPMPFRFSLFYIFAFSPFFIPGAWSLIFSLLSIFIITLEFNWFENLKNKKAKKQLISFDKNLSFSIKSQQKDNAHFVADFIVLSQSIHRVDEFMSDCRNSISYNLDKILGYEEKDRIVYFCEDSFFERNDKIHFIKILDNKKYASYFREYFRAENEQLFLNQYEELLDLNYGTAKLNFYLCINTFLFNTYLLGHEVSIKSILNFLDRLQKQYDTNKVECVFNQLLNTSINKYSLIEWAKKSSKISTKFFEEHFPAETDFVQEIDKEIQEIEKMTGIHIHSENPVIQKEAQEVLALVDKINRQIQEEKLEIENIDIHKELRINKRFLMQKISQNEKEKS